ncbi:uncharacterized protein LOC135331019 isoform X2 [Halichondria panicea]
MSNGATINPPCRRRSQEIEDNGLERLLADSLSSAIVMTKLRMNYSEWIDNLEPRGPSGPPPPPTDAESPNISSSQYFAYHHISAAHDREMTSVLCLESGKPPSLVPFIPSIVIAFKECTQLIKRDVRSNQEGVEKANLTSHAFGMIILCYTDDEPKASSLNVISEEAMKSGVKTEGYTQSYINIEIDDRKPQDENNTALYFKTDQFYYYIHVRDSNRPTLEPRYVNVKDHTSDEVYNHLQFRSVYPDKRKEDGTLETSKNAATGSRNGVTDAMNSYVQDNSHGNQATGKVHNLKF